MIELFMVVGYILDQLLFGVEYGLPVGDELVF